MSDRVFVTAGDWALGSDGIQWILYHSQRLGGWTGVSFVRTTQDVLAMCMREKGLEPDTAAALLFRLGHI